ncbi:MAG: hypothetical protein HZB39_14770 [Planctomycetes bacterium]|nr:hypothetical protein [Planctomycetota bacterium]
MVGILGICLVGCVSPGNQVREARAAVEIGRVDNQLAELRKAVAARLALIDAAGRELARTDGEWATARSRQRGRAADLRDALVQLAAIEEDLAAAGARRAAIEIELAPLRELEAKLADRQRLQQELTARFAGVDGELAALEAKAVELEAAVAQKRAELTLRFERARVLVERLQAALAWTVLPGDGVPGDAVPGEAAPAAPTPPPDEPPKPPADPAAGTTVAPPPERRG